MATDQEIRDSGLKYLPQQKYLQNPYELPVEEEVTESFGIPNTNAFNNSGNDFSVYNPDPNSISNRDYNPRPYYDATYEDTFGANAKDPLSNFTMTGDPEILARGDTGGQFYEPPPSKLEGLMSMIPGAGIARFLANQIGPYMPTNRRAIMENELSGQGIMVNDIGQIVQGGGAYDTAGNVMAGYNADKMTAKTFDDRIAEATLKMSDTNIDPNTGKTYKEARIAALEAGKIDFLNAQDKTDRIYDFEEEEKKKNKKNTVINRFLTKKKETKTAADAKTAATTAVGGTTTSSGLSAQEQQTLNNAYNAQSQASRNRQDQAGGSGGGQFDGASSKSSYDSDPTGYSGSFAKGGRVGYFFGGRARLQGGGGADMGAPEKAAERASKGYGTAPDTGSKSGTNDYSSFQQNVNHDRAMRDNQREKPSTLDNVMNLGSELSYLNNLKNLNVPGIALNFGVNKFRNYMKNKNLLEEDKLSYNTNPLPTDNYMAKVTRQDLARYTPRNQKELIDKTNYIDAKDQFLINPGMSEYEFQEMKKGNITEPGTYVGANGGRVNFKNGGLASIL